MTKKLISCVAGMALGVAMLTSCADADTVTVSGEIRGAKNGTLYLMKEDSEGYLSIVDSVAMDKNGIFSLKAEKSIPQLHYVSFNKNATAFSFFIEDVPVKISAQVDSLMFASVEGGTNQTLYNEFNEFINDFDAKRSDLYLKVLQHGVEGGDADSLDIYAASYHRNILRKMQYIANFAKVNAEHEISPMIALAYLSNGYSPILDSIAVSFSPNAKECMYGRDFLKYLDNLKKSEVGQPAPAFEVVKDSVTYNNASFAGKDLYLMLWATGSQESQMALLDLKKVYEKWNKKGLEVLTACITNDTTAYENETFYLSAPWVDVHMQRSKNNPIITTFALTGNLPIGILIDSEGLVHAKYILPSELEQILTKKNKKK